MLERGTMPSPRRTCAEATLAATSTAMKIILRIFSSLRNSWHEPIPTKTLADSIISPSEFLFRTRFSAMPPQARSGIKITATIFNLVVMDVNVNSA
jgi:hypothetical protein